MPADPTETRSATPETPPHDPSGPALDAGLAAAFGPDPTAAGWLRLPPTDGGPSDCPSPVGAGSPCGRYHLLGQIGHGGMGEVYRAEDAVFGREVAVKVLRPEVAGPTAAARFLDEARVTGRLAHPGVPAVHDLGTLPDGRPFLAMKLVKGRTLADLLAERPDPAADRGKVVRHFLQVCQAVAYAHSKGVIHRDLKPGNVMVGSFDEVQVMDWGLARTIRGEGGQPTVEPRANAASVPDSPFPLPPSPVRTRTGSVLGTPAFMPPEQARGETAQLDERADVFGLGAVLCVILTGKPPYAGDTAETVQRLAARGDLAGALARLDGCGADPELVGLCKRCLAPKPEARPRDAGKVADAVAGYLAGVEDRARRAELERAAAAAEAKEQRKRRRVQAALGLTFTALVALGGAFAWWRDKQATNRAAEERVVAAERETSRAAALSTLRLAADLGRQYRFAEAGAALDQAGQLATRAGADDLIPTVEQARADLAFVRDLDEIRMRRSIWIPEEGGEGQFDTTSAAPAYRDAFLARGLDVAGGEPGGVVAAVRGSAVRTDLVAALDDWTLFEKDEGTRDRVLAVARLTDPGPWLDRFRDPAVRGNRMALGLLARSADVRLLTPGTITTLSGLVLDHGLDPSQLLFDAHIVHPGDFLIPFTLGQWSFQQKQSAKQISYYLTARSMRPEHVSVLINLGNALLAAGDASGAVVCHQQALLLDPNSARGHFALGRTLALGKGDLEGGVACQREAIRRDPAFARAHLHLGLALRDQGKLPEALVRFHRVTELIPDDPWGHGNVGWVLHLMGDHAGAAEAYRKALQLAPTSAKFHSEVARILAAAGDLEEAVKHHREAVRLDPKYVNAGGNLGLTLHERGDAAGAIAALWDAVCLDPKNAVAHSNLGNALKNKGDLDGAIRHLREAARLDPRVAAYHVNLGKALNARGGKGDVDEAIRCLGEAIRLDPKQVSAHVELGMALRVKGALDGAIDAYHEAIRLSPGYAWAHNNLGNALRQQKKLDDAIRSLREAVRLDPKAAAIHTNLGNALRDKGEVDEAFWHLREGVRLDPKDSRCHSDLGFALLEDGGELSEALACFRAVTRLTPNNSWGRRNVGWVLHLMGDHAAAAEAYREAIRLAPSSPTFRSEMGVILAAKGNLEEAITQHEEAVRFASTTALYRHRLEAARKQLKGLIAPMPRPVKPSP